VERGSAYPFLVRQQLQEANDLDRRWQNIRAVLLELLELLEFLDLLDLLDLLNLLASENLYGCYGMYFGLRFQLE